MISSVVSIQVSVSPSEAFRHVVPIDLTSIFRGYGLLPAVVRTEAQTGAWDAIGQTRIVHLSDGSHAQELLTQYSQPNYFAYVVSNFSGILGFLVTAAIGEWWFENCDYSANSTLIRWSYTFTSKSLFTVPILWLVNKFLWSGYMRSVVSNVKEQLDAKALK
ncbi:SRPBCC family protein [Chamaesiphon sp. OTE_20_metabat_361]|uniref:SRPBCC family protein n=1 Tax=Chamaesiphon sp. OTE_20_metabat_361 TaxID=2964689 RepID=UPI002869F913|nr:SRPBCC family protein [Chamaesiphon sp. OTE_20_metabat_361]